MICEQSPGWYGCCRSHIYLQAPPGQAHQQECVSLEYVTQSYTRNCNLYLLKILFEPAWRLLQHMQLGALNRHFRSIYICKKTLYLNKYSSTF